jgi:hypothetical protein
MPANEKSPDVMFVSEAARVARVKPGIAKLILPITRLPNGRLRVLRPVLERFLADNTNNPVLQRAQRAKASAKSFPEAAAELRG